MSTEWHFYSDSDHGWRKVRSTIAPNERKTTHESGPGCHRLCREGLWPIPPELSELAVSGNPGIGPWGVKNGEHADSWYVVTEGRVFQLTRWSESYMVLELQYREHQPYSWIPNCERYFPRTTDWIGVQSKHVYLDRR